MLIKHFDWNIFFFFSWNPFSPYTSYMEMYQIQLFAFFIGTFNTTISCQEDINFWYLVSDICFIEPLYCLLLELPMAWVKLGTTIFFTIDNLIPLYNIYIYFFFFFFFLGTSQLGEDGYNFNKLCTQKIKNVVYLILIYF